MPKLNAASVGFLLLTLTCGGSASRQTAALHAGTATASASATDAPAVQVVLFAEALCPFCASFLTDVMHPLLQEPGFDAIVNFRYVAWGNAHNSTEGVRCQHGPTECRLNRIITCATHTAPERSRWLPFLVCLEGAPAAQREAAVGECARQAGVDAGAVQECAAGGLGDELELEAAQETEALDPPHAYVPWVTVQGIPLWGAFEDVKRYICVAYTGKRPEGCFAPPPESEGAALGAAAGGLLSTPRALW